jgi:hypothetical protein
MGELTSNLASKFRLVCSLVSLPSSLLSSRRGGGIAAAIVNLSAVFLVLFLFLTALAKMLLIDNRTGVLLPPVEIGVSVVEVDVSVFSEDGHGKD